MNCFILKQTRHVIKVPQDAQIKLAKLIQIIFTHLFQTKAQWKNINKAFETAEGEHNGHPHGHTEIL